MDASCFFRVNWSYNDVFLRFETEKILELSHPNNDIGKAFFEAYFGAAVCFDSKLNLGKHVTFCHKPPVITSILYIHHMP